jgi:hypothetical protein
MTILKTTSQPAAYSDHNVVWATVRVKEKLREEEREFWTRNWYGYTKEKLLDKISKVDWECDIMKAQDYYNWLENKLIDIIDELAPLTKRQCVNTSSYKENNNKRLINKHRRLVA